MSVRAQLSLLVFALAASLEGSAMAAVPVWFGSGAYDGIKLFASIQYWGVLWLAVGVLCSVAAFARSPKTARVAFLASVAVWAFLAGSVLASWVALGALIGPTMPILCVCWVLLQIILMSVPLRVPLEDYIAARIP